MRLGFQSVPRVLPLLAVALMLAGCTQTAATSPPAEPISLHVVNVDGPEVSVLVAGKVVAVVPCGNGKTLAPGGSLPGLPWSVVVRANDGETLASLSVSSLPQVLLIRGRGVMIGPLPMSYGPAPVGTPCQTAAGS
jgi:hypothetical protein